MRLNLVHPSSVARAQLNQALHGCISPWIEESLKEKPQRPNTGFAVIAFIRSEAKKDREDITTWFEFQISLVYLRRPFLLSCLLGSLQMLLGVVC